MIGLTLRKPKDTQDQTIQAPRRENWIHLSWILIPKVHVQVMGKLQGTLPSSSPLEGSYLNGLPYNFFDRFPGVPSVTQEMCCKDPYLAGEWTYYQEVDNFTGLFQTSAS